MSNTNDVPNPASAATWNERYKGEEYLFGTEPNQYLREKSALWKAGDRVLCVADGEGRNSVWLARQGVQVDAFDISEVGVNKAQKLARAAGVSVNCTVSDSDSFAWQTAAYDGVATIFNQFADPDMRARMFANMVRCLKPGGLVVLLGYTPKQLEYKTGGPPHLSHYYTPELLTTSFAGFDAIELREWEADLKEGTRHSGISALIGFVARKR